MSRITTIGELDLFTMELVKLGLPSNIRLVLELTEEENLSMSEFMAECRSKISKINTQIGLVEVKTLESIKPPIELKPRKVFLEERLREVKDAIIDKMLRHKSIPSELIDEYDQLCMDIYKLPVN
jgi:hypothetical protein